MNKSLQELLSPFNSSNTPWYLVPKGFWPSLNNPKGIQGFHRFLEICFFRNAETQMDVLSQLSDDGFVIPYRGQADYPAHYRNRINFAKKIGFVEEVMPNSQSLTSVGEHFVFSSAEKWPEIFEHQLIRLQFTNPSMPSRYSRFRLFPYIFTLNLLLDIDGNYISVDEFVLRVLLTTNQTELGNVIDWINTYRNLPEKDKQIARSSIKNTRFLAARVITYLFGCTPACEFITDTLALADKERAKLILSKCAPYLKYTDYSDLLSWSYQNGKFDKRFWPLMPQMAPILKERHEQYIKRQEGEDHKSIKQYLISNSENVLGKGAALFEEEYYFASGDSADLVFSMPNSRFITIEVEVDIMENDIAGFLQAIKYKYMFAAQCGLLNEQVTGMLIARSIHPSIKDLCSQYGIECEEINVQ